MIKVEGEGKGHKASMKRMRDTEIGRTFQMGMQLAYGTKQWWREAAQVQEPTTRAQSVELGNACACGHVSGVAREWCPQGCLRQQCGSAPLRSKPRFVHLAQRFGQS